MPDIGKLRTIGHARPDLAGNERSSGVPWYRRTGAWIGMGTGPGALMTGAAVTGRAGAAVAIPAVVTGCIVLYFVCVAHGLQANRSRTPMGTSVQEIFGGRSGWTLTTIMVLAMTGWCGFYIGVGGAALSNLVGMPQVVGACALGMVVLGLCLLGQERWNPLTYLTAGCAVALTVITVVAVPNNPPPTIQFDPVVGFMAAFGGMISYAVVFAMRVPDFTVDINKESGVWIVGFTMLVPLLALALLGVSLYARTGLFNLADLLAGTQQPQAGQLFLTLSTIAPSVTALYSGAISIESLVRVPRVRPAVRPSPPRVRPAVRPSPPRVRPAVRPSPPRVRPAVRPSPPRAAMVAMAACATVLGAARFDQKLIGFLEVLGAVIPPALVVMLLTPRLTRPPRSPHPLLAWLAGAAAALLLHGSSSFVGSIAGCVVAGAWLWLSSRLVPRALDNRHND